MFKLTGSSGHRRSGGSSTVARVSASRLNRVAFAPVPTRGAWVPETMQEQGQDSSTARTGGLEKVLRFNGM